MPAAGTASWRAAFWSAKNPQLGIRAERYLSVFDGNVDHPPEAAFGPSREGQLVAAVRSTTTATSEPEVEHRPPNVDGVVNRVLGLDGPAVHDRVSTESPGFSP